MEKSCLISLHIFSILYCFYFFSFLIFKKISIILLWSFLQFFVIGRVIIFLFLFLFFVFGFFFILLLFFIFFYYIVEEKHLFFGSVKEQSDQNRWERKLSIFNDIFFMCLTSRFLKMWKYYSSIFKFIVFVIVIRQKFCLFCKILYHNLCFEFCPFHVSYMICWTKHSFNLHILVHH